MEKHTFANALGLLACGAALVLAGCSSDNYIVRESPNKPYKDYDFANRGNASVLGVGEPISVRQMRADATFNLKGNHNLEAVLKRMATNYNVAVRWGNGVRKTKRKEVLINSLGFDEARAYIEDVYDVQIIREGERRLLVLPSASETRLASFNPGQGVTLADALRGLAEQCGYNLVVTESRQILRNTRVSTRLNDVSCLDAFEALLSPHGLSIVNAGDYYTIGGLPQRQWTLNLYEPVRSETVQVNYSSDISGGESDEGGSTSTAGGASRVQVTYQRDLWADLQTDLQELLAANCSPASSGMAPAGGDIPTENFLLPPSDTSSLPAMSFFGQEAAASSAPPPATGAATASLPAECGYVRVNRHVGTVQVRASRSVLEEADEIVSRTEEIASRRLMLEARVLAVSKNRNYNQDGTLMARSGDVIGGFNSAATDNVPTTLTGNSSIADDGTTSIASALAGFLDASGGSGSAGSIGTGAGGFVGVANRSLQAAVQFLEAYGTTYELMHPRIELMDRQRATLIDGRNEKYFVLSTSTDADTNTESVNVEERSQFLGLQFSAAAQVGEEGDAHTVSVQIPITSFVRNVQVPASGGGSTVPIASTRLIDQQVRLHDGEIKVIGGLTKTIAIDKEAGIPLFRELPLAGKLGNAENVSYENVEFVVLLQVKRLD